MLITVLQFLVQTEPPLHSELLEQVKHNKARMHQKQQLQPLKAASVLQSAAGSACTLVYSSQEWRRKSNTRVEPNDRTREPASGELLALFSLKPMRGSLCDFHLFAFATEECVLSLWAAALPPDSSLPKGENYSPNYRGIESTFLLSYVDLSMDLKCCLFLLSRVCCMPVLVVDSQIRNSTKPGLTSSNAVLCSSSLQR